VTVASTCRRVGPCLADMSHVSCRLQIGRRGRAHAASSASSTSAESGLLMIAASCSHVSGAGCRRTPGLPSARCRGVAARRRTSAKSTSNGPLIERDQTAVGGVAIGRGIRLRRRSTAINAEPTSSSVSGCAAGRNLGELLIFEPLSSDAQHVAQLEQRSLRLRWPWMCCWRRRRPRQG
jgi:hypothetical protein